MELKVGQKVRGMFELCDSSMFGRRKRTMYQGEISEIKGDSFTVQYQTFKYTYRERDIGRILFLNQQQEDLEEQSNRERRWGD